MEAAAAETGATIAADAEPASLAFPNRKEFPVYAACWLRGDCWLWQIELTGGTTQRLRVGTTVQLPGGSTATLGFGKDYHNVWGMSNPHMHAPGHRNTGTEVPGTIGVMLSDSVPPELLARRGDFTEHRGGILVSVVDWDGVGDAQFQELHPDPERHGSELKVGDPFTVPAGTMPLFAPLTQLSGARPYGGYIDTRPGHESSILASDDAQTYVSGGAPDRLAVGKPSEKKAGQRREKRAQRRKKRATKRSRGTTHAVHMGPKPHRHTRRPRVLRFAPDAEARQASRGHFAVDAGPVEGEVAARKFFMIPADRCTAETPDKWRQGNGPAEVSSHTIVCVEDDVGAAGLEYRSSLPAAVIPDTGAPVPDGVPNGDLLASFGCKQQEVSPAEYR